MHTSLDHSIGQMLMIGFRGLAIHEASPIAHAIHQYHLGGVLLFDYDSCTQRFDRNIQSAAQLHRLVHSLQSAAAIPLLIAIDQEGGAVCRLKERYGFPPTVSAQELGSRNQPDLTRSHGLRTAVTLEELGINLNLAPVVDLNRNPESPAIGKVGRSFSAFPDIVTAHARAWIAAHHERQILCALKHFPGHGSASHDSHHGFVDVSETWAQEELLPYSSLIRSGHCDLIMTAHVFHAGRDPEHPATLSFPTITGLLRQQLGYDGVVISDDMQMKAITSRYSLQEAVYLAISAGVDILVFGNNLEYDEEIALRVTASIKDLVKGGRLSPERLAQSYQRIMRLKKRLRPPILPLSSGKALCG